MKKTIIFIFMLSAILYGCTPKNSMNGAWKVVSFENKSGDKVKMKLNDNMTGDELKIWSKDHYMYVGRYKMDTTNFDNYGSGTYTVAGNHYVEMPIIASRNKNAKIDQIRILLDRKNDTIVQTWPADEKWNVDKNNYYIQKLVPAD